jgi:Na+-transporting NADH:ubiquinone oxidoreductase subunit NqrC
MGQTLDGILLVLVALNLVNSVLVVLSIGLVWRTLGEISQICDKIKNILIVDRRRFANIDRG